MTEDHHHYKQRLETAVANIQNSDKVREENKELVVEFGNWLALRSISYGRQYRYISSLKQIIEHNDFRLDNLKEEMIEKMEEGENHSEQFVHVGLADNKETEGQINRNAIQFLNELWDVKENILKLKNEALYNPEISSDEIDELEQLLERVSDPGSNPEFMEEQLNDLMNPGSIEDIEEEVEEKLADLNL